MIRRTSAMARSAAIFFLFSLVILFLCPQCSNTADEIRDYSRLEREPMLEAEAIDLVMTEKGRIVVRVQANTMNSFDRDEKQYDEFPQGIVVQSYDADGNLGSSIRAEYAIYQRREKIWEARTRVVAVNEKGDSIQTEQIFWDESKGRVYTSANVRIRTSSAVLFGKGMESDDRFIDWEIKEPTGIIAVPGGADTPSPQKLQMHSNL